MRKFPIPKGPRSMFPTRPEDVLTGCNIIPIGRHSPSTQTRVEIQIPMRKNNPVPRWHVGHSERQRRRELVCQGLIINHNSMTDMRDQSAWRVGGTYSHSGDSDDAPKTISANAREVSTIPSYEFYGTSQLTSKLPDTTSLTESSTTTGNASSDYQRLNNGCSEPTSKRQNPNAPHDPSCSSSQTATKKRRHMCQDSSESRSSSRHQTKRLKSTDRPRGSPDRFAEDPGDGQLGINSRNLVGALTSSRASPKGKGKSTQPLGVSSPFGSETFFSDTAGDMDSSPADTDAPSLDPGSLHSQRKANDALFTNSAQPDILGHDPFPTNLDDDSEITQLQRLQPFPTVSSSRVVLNDCSLNIPSMRFRSMPPPRAMNPPLHRRLLPPQMSDILPLSIKNSVREALKECLQENQVTLQALQPQVPPQPVFAIPLPPPAAVRQRGDSHHFGDLNQEQVVTMIKNPNLGPAARFSSAPGIFTYRGTVREQFQWLGAKGHFTEPEWKNVGGKMKNFRPRAE